MLFRSCFDKAGIRRRVLASSCYPAFFRGHQRVGTPEYLTMMRLRKIWAEGSFSVLKREHCISRIRKRGILAATEECLLAAMALNLKRMAKCHLSLSPNLLFCWGHDGFQQFFCFCQQVLFILVLYQLSYPCMAGGFFIAVCVALYAYEYGNLPETAISVKWLFATCAGHILISKAGNVDGCC